MSKPPVLARDAESGLVGRFGRLVRRLPGGDFALEQIDKLEQELLTELKQRLDRLEQRTSRAARRLSAVAAPVRTPPVLLKDLLERSQEQTRQETEAEFFCTLLEALTPDEARILAALSDGSAYPLVHVVASPLVGGTPRRLVENASNIGRSAALQLPALGSRYVTRLRALGLIDTGPEDEKLSVQYEMLEADGAVRRALTRAEEGRRKGSVVRRTLRMSDLGRALWAAAHAAD